jgi:tRNA/tmRNA/rRNA uracil-C5-methylase (TrmA/RlmC/RlmD family)
MSDGSLAEDGQARFLGERVELTIGPVAHGGHCVARLDGQVVFVRHTLPGERVIAEITSLGTKFLRADAVEILDPSADRVEPACPFSGPGRCGGCDWQHVSLPAQRRLKEAVLAEQMLRLGKIETQIVVEPVSASGVDPDVGLNWRTRVSYAVNPDGRAGLRQHRSHEVVAISHCPIATDAVNAMGITSRPWSPEVTIEVVASSMEDQSIVVRQDRTTHVIEGPQRVRERVGELEFAVSASGFWQVHPGAPETLVGVVSDFIEPRPGKHLIDLYGGAGLFSGAFAPIVQSHGRIDMVEGNRKAIADARRVLGGDEWVRIHEGDVLEVLRMMRWRACDGVILDPPRTGAGEAVVREIARISAPRIVYVACDPAALARDVAYFDTAGYRMERARAFDLFPMTHHVESVALFTPNSD